MKNKLISLGMTVLGPKIVRQILAATGGFLAAQGMAVDDTSLFSLVAGAIAYALASAYSYFAKARPDAERQGQITQIASALASQAIAFIAGYLQSLGYDGHINDAFGMALFSANYGLSKLSRPDPATPRLTVPGKPASQRPPSFPPS